MPSSITVQTIVNAPMEKVWDCWTNPQHITHWAFASDDWEAPHAENDLRVGGKFGTVMAAKDKSTSFDFNGVYSHVDQHNVIEYSIEGGRKVRVEFESLPEGIQVTEIFEAETINSDDKQRDGWQAILDNFKKYVEAN